MSDNAVYTLQISFPPVVICASEHKNLYPPVFYEQSRGFVHAVFVWILSKPFNNIYPSVYPSAKESVDDCAEST